MDSQYVSNNYECSECSGGVYVLYPWNLLVKPHLQLKTGGNLMIKEHQWGKHNFCSKCADRLAKEALAYPKEFLDEIEEAALEFWIDWNYEVAQGRKEGEEWLDE